MFADTVYVIREIDFNIDGRTLPFALKSNGEFKEGERIYGKENLDKYLALRRQLLINQQVLDDVWIEHFIGESEEDDALAVRLLVHVKDSWNIIVLPQPKYDSNEGFSLTLKARDYNFLGTMSTLRTDLGYKHKDDEREINFSIESNTPFHSFGKEWNFIFDHFFTYAFEQPLYYQNLTGLSVKLPWKLTTFNVGLYQYLTVNEENSDEDREIFELDARFHGPYGSTELFASWKIPLGIEVANFGELSYTPKISGRMNYPYGNLDEPRKPISTFSHTIAIGRVDWIGNYRRGLSASMGNSLNWYFARSDAPLKVSLDGNTSFYWFFSSFSGFSARLNYRQWWHWSERNNDWIPYYYAGDSLRGILNDEIRAKKMLALNLDFPFRVLRFWPSEWLNNRNFRIFNFELHASPFTDIAIMEGRYSKLIDSDIRFNLDDMLNTAGLELIVFPDFFRSVKVRASIGYNINKMRNSGFPSGLKILSAWDEIFIGLEHFY